MSMEDDYCDDCGSELSFTCGCGTKKLPERINVMKVVTYDVQKIVEDVHECHGTPFDEITIEDCLTWISDWVADDFSCGHGHTADTSDLIFQDENGDDL